MTPIAAVKRPQRPYNDLREAIYTPLEDAVAMLDRRQSMGLLPDLDSAGFLDVPAVLKQPRMAVIFRQVGTPNHELMRAMALAQRVGLNLVVWEYHADRFLNRNACKHALGRMRFHHGVGRNGGRKTQCMNVIDFNQQDGRRMDAVQTLWGQPLIEFHHQLLQVSFSEKSTPQLFDASAWFARHGGRASMYYKAFAMLFLRHAVLFETFMMEGAELAFTREVFLPAVNDLVAAFGVRPLVARIEDIETEGDDYWLSYPGVLHEEVLARMHNAANKTSSIAKSGV
ncbi:MAG: hypothetical protein U1F34_00855 [Gammaproteobacteria bacterium]